MAGDMDFDKCGMHGWLVRVPVIAYHQLNAR